MKDISSSPWCEKYRPKNFSNIVLESKTRTILDNIIKDQHFPHLLFYGPPGAGKTTSAENLIRKYQETYSRVNKETVMHLNASDERGIEVIRTQIYQFCKSKNMFEKGLKFVVLDEADYMTKNAQQALKNLIQSCTNDNVRFCLICNYICKLDDSLKNEFICIRFNHVENNEIISLMKKITEKENISVSDNTLKMIQQMFNSDIRSMINFIQIHHNDPNWSKYIFDSKLWYELHELFKSECNTNDDNKIKMWFYDIQKKCCNISIIECIKKYFNYILSEQKQLINKRFIDIFEVIIHSPDFNDDMLDYFILNLLEIYKLKIEQYK